MTRTLVALPGAGVSDAEAEEVRRNGDTRTQRLEDDADEMAFLLSEFDR